MGTFSAPSHRAQFGAVCTRLLRFAAFVGLGFLALEATQRRGVVASPAVEDPRAERSIVFVDSGPDHGVAFAIARSGTRTIFLTANHVVKNAGPLGKRETPVADQILVRKHKGDFPPKTGTWITGDHDLDLALFAVDDYPLPPFCLGTQAARSSNVDLATFSQDAYAKDNNELTPLETGARITGVTNSDPRTFYFDGSVIEGYSGSPIFEADSGLLVGIAISYSKDAILERRGVDAHAIRDFYTAAQLRLGVTVLPNIGPGVQNGPDALYQLGAASRNVLSYRLYLDQPQPTRPTDQQFFVSLSDKLKSWMRWFGPVVADEVQYSRVPSLDAVCSSVSTPGVVIVSFNKPTTALFNPQFDVSGYAQLIRCLDRRDRKRIALKSPVLPQPAVLTISVHGLKGLPYDKWVTTVSAAIAQNVAGSLVAQLGQDQSAAQNFYYAGVPIGDAGKVAGRTFCDELAYHGDR